MTKGPRRTDSVRIFLRLAFSFAAVAILSASSCPTSADDDLGCGQSDSMSIHFGLTGDIDPLISPDLTISSEGGRRTFSWSRLVENVCSNEHVRASWSLTSNPSHLPPGFSVDAGYLLTALTGSNVTLAAKNEDTNTRIYQGETEIGLRQAFDGEAGRFLIFLDISFTSQGGEAADRLVATGIIRFMTMQATYRQAKAN